MTIKLYGYPFTTCTRRVQVVLDKKQVPYELVVLDTVNKEHKSPKYLKKQPFGVSPTLTQALTASSTPISIPSCACYIHQDDDGFIVYESRAICHYIATKFADQGTRGLVPTDPKANAHFMQAASVEQSYFSPYADKAVAENLFKPWQGKTSSKELFESYTKSLDANLDRYECILSKQKYLAGDDIALADLFHLPYGSLLPAAKAPLLTVESRPNVARWWKDISSRPSWQKYS